MDYGQSFEFIPIESTFWDNIRLSDETTERFHIGAHLNRTPLDESSVTTKALNRRRRNQNLYVWWLEFLSCVVMIGAFFAIVGTLISYQGQPIPRWPSAISINALVSIDIVIIKIVVGVVVSRGE
jgi:hypothetical protein